jgi:hypothetical protein
MEKLICGIIIGEHPSIEEAQKHVRRMKNCPYLVASGTSRNKIYSVFIVPEDKRWWLKYPEMDPSSTGMGKAQVFIVENVAYPEKLGLKIPDQKTTISPCGENCEICRLPIEFNCRGCPATIHYVR